MSKSNDIVWMIERTLPELNGQWVLWPWPFATRKKAREEVGKAKAGCKASVRCRISKYTRSK